MYSCPFVNLYATCSSHGRRTGPTRIQDRLGPTVNSTRQTKFKKISQWHKTDETKKFDRNLICFRIKLA